VVRVLLERAELRLDQRDTEGFTALFHACNHGKNRVGDQHGYFRRLWSWDLRDILLIIIKYLFVFGLSITFPGTRFGSGSAGFVSVYQIRRY
jgi:hypothetical protein